MIRQVRLSKKATAQLKKIQKQIATKFAFWVLSIDEIGLISSRKQHPGCHDEPLLGQRQGQRSVRLNRQWRAIYVVLADKTIEFIEVQEITPHDY